MAPISIIDLADKVPLAEANWNLLFQQQMSTLGSGQTLVADLAPPAWEADVRTIEAYHADIRAVRALLNRLSGGLGSFFLYDPAAIFPRLDPAGALLGTATPTIHSIGTSRRLCRIAGLPPGYRLSVGDMAALDHGAQAQRSLVEICSAVTADGAGITPELEVSPPLRPSVTAGNAVTLRKPSAVMRIVPGSMRMNMVSTTTSQIAFKARQALGPY